jgi:muconolactone delta-isomerase
MEFLVEFELDVPEGTAASEVEDRNNAESAVAARLAAQGHLARVWIRRVEPGHTRVVGLYRADGEMELNRIIRGLPLYDWMQVTVTPLEPHPNDPAAAPVG